MYISRANLQSKKSNFLIFDKWSSYIFCLWQPGLEQEQISVHVSLKYTLKLYHWAKGALLKLLKKKSEGALSFHQFTPYIFRGLGKRLFLPFYSFSTISFCT